jgi:hypothetical protein
VVEILFKKHQGKREKRNSLMSQVPPTTPEPTPPAETPAVEFPLWSDVFQSPDVFALQKCAGM